MHHHNELSIRNLGIDTYRENIIYMRSDCHICVSEGFTALTRVVVSNKITSIIATLNVINSEILSHGEAGLSIEAINRLNAKEGDTITVSHLQPIPSVRLVRSKMYGKELTQDEFDLIISDITQGLYSNIELAAFITVCSGNNLSLNEIQALTKSMVQSGKKLAWETPLIYDKHCIGGLPGNRTTPIVVSIVAAAGLTIPKTSSRAITSPAGTADTMEVMTNVKVSMSEMQRIVKQEHGCIVWGGSVNLSPADDILISIEKALDIDSEGQMIASVLSKKVAAGSTHVAIDIPVGNTAKVRTEKDALKLKEHFEQVANSIGIKVKCLITDGSQPIGRGIGPALEAMDVLSVLRNEADAPEDLRQRALLIAGELLELSGIAKQDKGIKEAENILANGSAYIKFLNICKAQGRFTEPSYAKYKFDVKADTDGIVIEIDSRRLAKVAKLAGAPKASKAGIIFLSPLQKEINTGDVLFSIYAESQGELNYAIEYYNSQTKILLIK
jgi:thymidine phosphorylase